MKTAKIRLNNWRDLFLLDEYLLDSFVFRGQSNSEWSLSTSLERVLTKYGLSTDNLQNKEYWMLHEFKRKFQLYDSAIPEENDHFEWLAIMQHHGTPTRLLDFTHSVFLASFFAVSESNSEAAVWGINLYELRKIINQRFALKERLGEFLRDKENIEYIKIANKELGVEYKPFSDLSFVIPLEPKKATKRLSQQQGLFITPMNGRFSFMENLASTFGLQDNELLFEELELDKFGELNPGEHGVLIIKFIIPKTQLKKINRDLAKMNITSEHVYPGLDGLAKSLSQSIILR